MELTEKEIEHIAYLSRIEITENEKKNFSSQLSEILNYVGQLKEVETKNVEEMARVSDLKNVLAQDVVETSDVTREQLMANSPEQFDNYFKVKTVLE